MDEFILKFLKLYCYNGRGSKILDLIKDNVKEANNDICKKIDKLDDKSGFLNDCRENSGTRIFLFSVVPWVLMNILIAIIPLEGIIIPAYVLSLISVVIPALIGVSVENIFLKRNLRDNFKEYANIKTQRDFFEEVIRNRIMLKKFRNESTILNRVIDHIYKVKVTIFELDNSRSFSNGKDDMIDSFISNYAVDALIDFSVKAGINELEEKDNELSALVFDNNIAGIDKLIKEEEKKLDVLMTKSVLSEIMAENKIHEKSIKQIIKSSFLSGLCAYFILLLPVIIVKNPNILYVGSSVESLIMLLSYFLVGFVSNLLYETKKKRDNDKVFENINLELGEANISNEKKLISSVEYNQELNKINDRIVRLRYSLESLQVIASFQEQCHEKKADFSYKFSKKREAVGLDKCVNLNVINAPKVKKMVKNNKCKNDK